LYDNYTRYEEHNANVERIQSQAAGIQNKIKKLKKDIKEIEKYNKNKKEKKARVKEVYSQIQKIQKQLPTESNTTEVNYMLDQGMKELNIQDTDITPGKSSVEGFYIETEHKIAGYGTFLQFLVFYENLKKSERLLNVSKTVFKVKKVDKGRFQMLDMTALIYSYKYNPKHKERSLNEVLGNDNKKTKKTKKKRKRRK